MSKLLIAELSGQQYRSAVLCQAKDDVRFYLNGIYISFESCEVAATNGHYLYCADVRTLTNKAEDKLSERFLKLNPEGVILESVKLPVKVDIVQIHLEGEVFIRDNFSIFNFTVTAFSKGNELMRFTVKNIEGRYPDYRQIIPAPLNGSNIEMDGCITYNTEYLAMPFKIFGRGRVNIEQAGRSRSGDMAAARMFTVDESKGVFVLMPLRKYMDQVK